MHGLVGLHFRMDGLVKSVWSGQICVVWSVKYEQLVICRHFDRFLLPRLMKLANLRA